ncbi:MAG: hypothetical protein ACQESR_23680 [Planctomycetota bacterium]
MEVIFSTFLVGVMLLATMRAVGGVFRTRLVAEQRLKGESLARRMMVEIGRHPYEDPDNTPTFGPESGEGPTRCDFDDVDDYAGWSASPPETPDGTPIPNCTGWTRAVEIQRVSVQSLEPMSQETGLKRMQVTVTGPGGEQFELRALRAASGGLELRPPIDRTYVAGVNGELRLGAQNSSSRAIAPVLNHAEDD